MNEHNPYIVQTMPPNPTFGTWYVIREERIPAPNYIRRVPAGFSFGNTLEYAARFPIANDAAAAIIERNAKVGRWGASSFVIVPVTVTTTPETVKVKTVEEKVPAKTEYALQLSMGDHFARTAGEYVKLVDVMRIGSYSYVLGQEKAYRFATAQAAADALQRRRDSGAQKTYGGSFVIVPIYTPESTTTKTVEEKVPGSVKVELA